MNGAVGMRGSSLLISNHKGVTLVELMVAVAILAIIAAIAIPSYRIFVKKAKMLEGEVALREIARLEDHYYLNNNYTYSDSLSALGFAPTPPLKYYTIQITLGAAGAPHLYQITATNTAPDLDSLILTVYPDGQSVLQHVNPGSQGGPSPADSSPSAPAATPAAEPPSTPSPPPAPAPPSAPTPPGKPDKPGKGDKKDKPEKPGK